MYKFILVLFLIPFIYCKQNEQMTRETMMAYLEKYGYTGNKTANEMSENDTSEAVMEFQKYVHIPMTGKLDDATQEMMRKPRCGMPDIPSGYKYIGKWNHKHLTYRFKNYPAFYDKNIIQRNVTRAMNIWLKHIDIVTERVDETADANIDINFLAEEQRGGNEANSLAYAYAPSNGSIFFQDEDWEGYEDYFFTLVAAHEFGHSLGLDHYDNNNKSIMYPIFDWEKKAELHSSDIELVVNLYGRKYSLCDHGKIDAAFSTNDYHVYIIRNSRCWRFEFGKLMSGYPKFLPHIWPGLPREVKAAYYYDSDIYFLVGKDVFRYDRSSSSLRFSFDTEYDAAVSIDTRLYTFKGDQYWRYNLNKNVPKLQSGFPKNMSALWKGVPPNIDAVYYDRKEFIYFFKDRSFYSLNIQNIRGGAVEKHISEWFGCKP